jgi:hypothetical protein
VYRPQIIDLLRIWTFEREKKKGKQIDVCNRSISKPLNCKIACLSHHLVVVSVASVEREYFFFFLLMVRVSIIDHLVMETRTNGVVEKPGELGICIILSL